MIRNVGTSLVGFVACIASLAAVLTACNVGVDELGSDTSKVVPTAEGATEGTGTTEPAPGSTVTTATGLPCDVDAVLKARCQTCHSAEPKYGASTPLVTWADLQKPGPGGSANKKVLELVKERVHDDVRPMPASPQPRLDAKELATLDSWIAGGAKATDASCTGKAPDSGVKPLSCKPDTVLTPKTPFVMKPGTPLDQYMCFGVDIDLAKKRHVTALAPKVDNKQIVHHILLFKTNKSESATPFPCEAFGSAAWTLVAGWAPGGNNLELPKEAGFPQEKGTTHWVLQVHYNNATAKEGTDQSGYELCTTEDLRPNDAGVLAFGSIAFSIPPRSNHKIACDYTLGREFDGVTMFNASPHMHTRGLSMSTERLAGGRGTPEMVFEQKNFSFEAQANYPITGKLAAGDVMRTRCGWKNPGDTTIGFGEGTGDEMCFNFVGYYPAIPDRTILGLPLFTWVTPSQNARCIAE